MILEKNSFRFNVAGSRLPVQYCSRFRSAYNTWMTTSIKFDSNKVNRINKNEVNAFYSKVPKSFVFRPYLLLYCEFPTSILLRDKIQEAQSSVGIVGHQQIHSFNELYLFSFWIPLLPPGHSNAYFYSLFIESCHTAIKRSNELSANREISTRLRGFSCR